MGARALKMKMVRRFRVRWFALARIVIALSRPSRRKLNRGNPDEGRKINAHRYALIGARLFILSRANGARP